MRDGDEPSRGDCRPCRSSREASLVWQTVICGCGVKLGGNASRLDEEWRAQCFRPSDAMKGKRTEDYYTMRRLYGTVKRRYERVLAGPPGPAVLSKAVSFTWTMLELAVSLHSEPHGITTGCDIAKPQSAPHATRRSRATESQYQVPSIRTQYHQPHLLRPSR